MKRPPSLEAVSDQATSGVAERRSVPRLALTGEQFRLKESGKVFSVADLSVDGMALKILDEEDLALFPVGRKIEGALNVRREKHAVIAQVVHVKRGRVGCHFENLEARTKRAFARYLDPAVLGAELKATPSGESGTIWYHGPSGTDLSFFKGTDGASSRALLIVFGTFVQWDTERGLSTGTASFAENAETLLFQADSAPDPDKLSVAKTLLLSSNVTKELKEWCLRRMSTQ
jgi:hypothetical protein